MDWPWGKRRVRSDDDVLNRHDDPACQAGHHRHSTVQRVAERTVPVRETVRGLKFYETPPYDPYNMLNLAYEESGKRR